MARNCIHIANATLIVLTMPLIDEVEFDVTQQSITLQLGLRQPEAQARIVPGTKQPAKPE